MLAKLLFTLFPLGAAYAAASDIMTMTIPNRLMLALIAGFVVVVPVAGLDLQAVLLHVGAGAVVLACGFVLFTFGWIGGGDAKFAAVVALWLGWSYTLEFVVTSAIFGGLLTLAILALRRNLLPAFALRQSWLFRLHDPKSGVPYGVALAAAALVIYPHTVWVHMVIG